MLFPIPLRFDKELSLSDDEFFEFCQQNRDLKLERDEHGQIIIGMPTGSKTGKINAILSLEVGIWNRQSKLGEVFDSSTGFTLQNSAVRSPDVSWVSTSLWNSIEEKDKEKFAPVCPEFLIELMSESDQLRSMKRKMESYIENGCQLGWLINLSSEEVYIYRGNGEIQIVKGFKDKKLYGEEVLIGFELDLGALL
jgi:Uma2 family endonuclease